MGIKIRFNPIATEDLQDIKAYLSEENYTIAAKTIRDIISNIEVLADFPEMGSPLASRIKQKSKYRYLVCGQYMVFYIYEEGIVSIQRILHAKRNYISLLLDDD